MTKRWTAWARKTAAGGTILALALSSMAPAAALAGGPVAFAATSCSLVGKYRSLGPTYANDLTVSHTSCSTGYTLIKDFQHCRLSHGGVKGYCRSGVLGFHCTEQRNYSSIQFISRVRCSKGRETVGYVYSQDI